jgi:phosphoglycolate phosphatase-like HAD superfamily hydrolase
MTLDVSRVQALCIDIDGTLSDTDDLFVQRLARWLAPASFLFPARNPLPFARRLVMATESPGNVLMGLPDRLGIDGFLARFTDGFYRLGLGSDSNPFLIIPGVQDALVLLKPRFPMSIVSTRGERTTRAFVEQFNLTHFFQCIVSAQTCRRTKPFPDPILYAAQQMGVPPEACLMIGDTTVDMRAGKAAGAQTVGVLCGFGEEAELLFAGADALLLTTAALPELLLIQ